MISLKIIPLYKLRAYFWSLFGIFGIVLFWVGIWEGIGYLPYLEKPYVSLIAGLVILFSSGFFLSEMGDKKTADVFRIHTHPRKHEFDFKYFDRIKNRYITINARKLKKIEKEAVLIFKHEGRELFIPIHRIKEIHRKGKLI